MIDTTFDKLEEMPAATIAVGSKVRPLVGPHAGILHNVIFATADGGFNIAPLLPAWRIKYRLGAAYAKASELVAA